MGRAEALPHVRHACAVLVFVGCVFFHAAAAAMAADREENGIDRLVQRLEAALESGSADELDRLLTPTFDRAALTEFRAAWYSPAITRAVVRERERSPVDGREVQLLLEVLVEYTSTGRMLTWQASAVETAGEWRLSSLSTLAMIDGLHRLQLDASRQFEARSLRIEAEDFELLLPSGDVFLCRVTSGVTALVLVGRGEMIFRPGPEAERHQVQTFSRSPVLRTPFRAAFLRMHPAEYLKRVAEDTLTEVEVDARTLRTAEDVFRVESVKSWTVDLGELSRQSWSLLPPRGDFLAEVRTMRFGTLTYVQSSDDPEDISLFDRAGGRHISVYASRARLEQHGGDYHENDQIPFEVLDYNVDVTFSPDRLWIDGRSSVKVRTTQHNVSSLTLRLNSALAVRSVSSPDHGRLLFMRVKNQNSLVVTLPALQAADSQLTLTVHYSGRLEPQTIEPETALLASRGNASREAEPAYVYSNRSYWYPQASMTDYATATIRVTVPPEYAAICSGVQAEGSPVTLQQPERRLFVFTSTQPVRYLGCAVSRFTAAGSATLDLSRLAPGSTPPGMPAALVVDVQATPRARGRARDLLERLEDIAQFYTDLMQDAPYPRFTLAVLESAVPGGHSPPYFAAYNHPLPGSPVTWGHDPTSFANYPEFFLAHEVAHQWWGHAVGWQNYHEQWLSEGFSQYFAALYAEHRRGSSVFDSVVQQMSGWAVRSSSEGPVSLGYRLGHLKGDPRFVRALIYNKGAIVLHMLRRMAGDEAFFRAIRSFYREHRFSKTGTTALRLAFERETGLDLERFFDRWIHGWTLPKLTHSSRVLQTSEGSVVLVQLTQQGDEVFDFPVTVTLRMRYGTVHEEVVAIRERTVEHRIPIESRLRDVRVNLDRATPLAR